MTVKVKQPIKLLKTYIIIHKTCIEEIYSLEYLIDSRFWHWEFEKDPNKPDHDKRPRSSQDGKIAEPRYNAQHFKHLKNHRHPQEEYHAGIELAPVVLQIRYFSLQTKQISAGPDVDLLQFNCTEICCQTMHNIIIALKLYLCSFF